MWIIAGTIPDPDFSLLVPEGPAPRSASLSEAGLHLPDGRTVPVERGTAALAATALQTCAALDCTPPALLLAGDTGSGSGSRRLYAWLEKALPALAPRGLTFHYLFPDVDWHNRLLLAVRELENAPLMVADAGFMYVAKMSGYADAYELFTPDVGELAFLADEKAPHPFYTRGFLLAEEQNIPVLLARAQEHGNCPANLIIKGKADHIIHESRLHAVVDSPSVPAMECIGGTGDIVTGLVTGLLCAGLPTATAALAASGMAPELPLIMVVMGVHTCEPPHRRPARSPAPQQGRDPRPGPGLSPLCGRFLQGLERDLAPALCPCFLHQRSSACVLCAGGAFLMAGLR
ncbi:NAD(P)H-hydrate dehydratase [Desulfovibrio piger]